MSKKKFWLEFFACLIVCFGALVLLKESSNGLISDKAPARRSIEEQQTIDVYKNVNETVAFITTIALTVDPFDLFYEMHPREGTGSGVVVDSKRGIVLTNLHVIMNSDRVEISLADGKNYKAKPVGFDKELDIAVLQIPNPPKNLKALELGDSSMLEVGQRVLAIGNPFGLNRTLTTGVVSSLDRTLKNPNGSIMRGLIQTDAPINPGNSGGPLLDMDGRLIGINTAILSQSGDSAGIGFAMPINQIRRVLPELIATGRVLRPRMGWMLVDTNQGPMILRVAPGLPAEQAGVQPVERRLLNAYLQPIIRDFDNADVISKVNGKVVRNIDEVEDIISKSESVVTLTLRRGSSSGPERTVKVKPILQ